jgi:hypothetical protein
LEGLNGSFGNGGTERFFGPSTEALLVHPAIQRVARTARKSKTGKLRHLDINVWENVLTDLPNLKENLNDCWLKAVELRFFSYV